jgi:hypothetical protein
MSVVTPVDLNSTPKPDEPTEPATSDDNEPQNALTQKFTEKEWAALKEFRVCPTAYLPLFQFAL